MRDLDRMLLVLGSVAFLAVTAVVVYLAATPVVPPSATQPQTSASPQYRPLAAPVTVDVGPREGARAPLFTAPRFGGETLSLADLRGKGVVMNFFASWCPPCRAEAPDLEATYRKYRDRGIVFLGVDIEQDTWEEADEFLKKFRITYPAVRDETGEIAKKYLLYGLPTTYFIDKDGVIRSKFVGPFLGPEGLKELDRRVRMLVP